jgi:hypothetical protein
MKTIPGECGGWLILLFVFPILFAVIYQSLKHSSLFQGRTTTIVALCVSILCILGMVGIPPGTLLQLPDSQPSPSIVAAEPGNEPNLSLLLPDSALGWLILIVLVVMGVNWLIQGFSLPGPNDPTYRNPSGGNAEKHLDLPDPWEVESSEEDEEEDDDSPGRWVS